MDWLLGHCVGKSDAHVGDVLKRAKIGDYYPQIREFRAVPRKQLSHKQRAAGVVIKRPVLVPLFPRYRLLNVDPTRPDLEEVFALAGIGGLVCNSGAFVHVPIEFVQKVMMQERDGAIPGATSARIVFSVGEHIRIGGNGPFRGFNAVVEEQLDMPIEELDPDTRIQVAITIFAKATRLEVPVEEAERL